MGQIFNIPFGQCFLKTLALRVRSDVFNGHVEAKNSFFAHASMHVWLPTNRSVIGLKESLLAKNDANFILPTLHSLTDLESKNPFALEAIENLPKAISAFERLALVMDFLPASLHVKKAFAIAEYLIALHDECIISDVSVERLESQYDATLFDTAPAHVQDAFQNLRILTYHLPNALSKRGLVTESWRRQQAMRILADELIRKPPDHPILIAGTTGTIPATRLLLKAVYSLPNGIVVLPGLETSCDSIRIENMRSHPQHTLHNLCRYLNIDPQNILDFDVEDDVSVGRRNDVRALFTPPPFDVKQKSINDPTLIECTSQAEEARVITAIVREKLFETDHSIAIVTPNQTLMRRLRAELAVYSITANDSAGTPLKETPVGSFLANFATFLHTPSNASFIHLVKHPLCAKLNRSEHLTFVRRSEILLRKKQHPWNSLSDSVLIQQLKTYMDRRAECKSFYDFVHFFKNAAFELSMGTLFKDNDGESAHIFFDALLKTPPFIRRDFEDALLTLMNIAAPVHTHEGLASRLRILGTLEARLNTADVVICASLNEGNWPKTPENDPILSDSFRLSVDLPSQKRRQGLAAHDFCASFYAPHLYITRPVREGGEVMLQSRLWTRAKGRFGVQNSKHQIIANYWQPSPAITHKPPTPMPLKAYRSKTYYASHVERLVQDPYAYYMRYLLGLDPLPALDESVSAKDKGQMFHAILDTYVKAELNPSFEKLLQFSKPFFDELYEKGGGIVKTFWWYRFIRIAKWWHEKFDTEPALYRVTEASGEIKLIIDKDLVALKSRADRIECPLTGSSLRIIDYKTGSLPTRKSVETGSSPQLLVEAVIAHEQGFGDIFPADGVFQLEYWRLTGADPAGECLVFNVSPEDRVQIKASIKRVLDYYLCDDSPYLANGKFTHSRFFSRMEEWEAEIG